MEKSKEVLSHYVLSLSSIVYMLHFDYEVTDKLIDELAREHRRDVFEFHNALGEISFETKAPVGNSEQQTSLEEFLKNIDERARTKDIESASYKEIFIVLKDIDEELQNPRVLAMLKRMANDNLTRENYSLCVFVVGVGIRIPKEIEPFITLFEFPMPNVKEIQAIMEQFAKDYGIDISQKDLDELSLLLKGLNEFQIKRILTLEYQENGDITEKSKDLILVEKKQFIKKAGMLEIIDFKESMDDLGGLENLKTWLKNKARIIKNLDQAIKCGVDIPKGVMIVGMPGCGKSLAAKVCAKLFEIPLIRLDVGKLLGKYIGESESNMQKALRLTEAINPCVLWIDEVEKAFSGIGRGGGHEVTTRLFGQFLTWMQEKNNAVFVVATANDISSMPPEFLRKGRFDELFFVDLPNLEERKAILQLHLHKRKQKTIDVFPLLKATEGFSGADLESVVKDSIEKAFVDKDSSESKLNLDVGVLEETIKNTKSISVTLKQKIEDLRKSVEVMDIRSASYHSSDNK